MHNWNMYYSIRKGKGNIFHTEISCPISSKAKESKRKIKGKNTIFQFMNNLWKYLNEQDHKVSQFSIWKTGSASC